MSEEALKAKIRTLALEILAGNKRGDFAPDCYDALAERVSGFLRAEDGLKLEQDGIPRRDAPLTSIESLLLSEIFSELLDAGYLVPTREALFPKRTRFKVHPEVPLN